MVDIVMRAKGNPELTRAAIDSIRASTPPGTYRLILVDDGSEPPLDVESDITLRHDQPLGAVSATNTGIAAALDLDGDFVLVLDNDIRIPPGDSTWLSRWVAEAERHGPSTAALGATTNFANPPQHILTTPTTYTAEWKGEDGRLRDKENPPVRWFVSFAVLLRKDALRACGPWDTRYDPGNFEDTDYSMTLRCAGFQLRVAQSVYIHHEGHKTFSDDLKRLLTTNQEKFYRKWGVGRLWDMGFIQTPDLAKLLRAASQ